ncbi:MAG: hypothetical protein P8L71_06780, partial [Flavobacteriales bacterium]|nr:hypothetical protein [Flavobacteriales bacterium]
MRTSVLFLASVLVATTSLFAQTDPAEDPDWSVVMHDESMTFFEIQDLFTERWMNREVTPGCGWKPFKRWEHMMMTRVDEDGNLRQAGDIYRSHQDAIALRTNRSESGNWQVLGPILDAQTTRENIPGVGRINHVAFHPTDENIIFCGAPAGGVWRTYDGGESWESNTDDLPTLGISAIAFDPINPMNVYIGTGDRDANDAPGMGVMKSTDGGLSWEFANDGMEDLTIGDLIVNPDDSNIVIAATEDGIFRSTDGAATWEQVSDQQYFYKEVCFKPGDPNTVYATGQGRFFRSDDGGANWNILTGSSGIQNATRMVIAVTAADPEVVYVLSANTYEFRKMFRSADSGQNFEEMSDEPNILGWSATGDSDGGQAWYDLCMQADQEDADRVYVGGIRMKRTDDGGVTWIDIQNGYLHVDQHWIEASPHNNDMYLCNDGGIYRYEDNEEWVDISKGIIAGQIYKFGQAPIDGNRALSGYQDNGTMEWDGVSWDRTGGADGFECAYDPEDESWRYNSIYYGRIYRTSPDFNNQQIAGLNELDIDEDGAWSSPFLVSKENGNRMMVGLRNVWRSNNIKHPIKDSIHWEKMSYLLGGNDNSNINNLIQHKADSNIVYASEGSRKLFRCDNILTENGEDAVWMDLSNSLPWINVPVTALESHPTDSATVYLGFDERIWKSIDSGQEWEDISGSLPETNINSIAYDVNSDEGLYIGTDMGIYYRDASMDDWISFSNNFPLGVSVTELELFYGESPEQNRLRASTYGRGLWESDLFGAETNFFPATGWLSTGNNTPEVFEAFEVDAGFFRSLENVTVTDFDPADIVVTNGAASNIQGGPDYTFTVTPDAFGLVEIVIPVDAALDDNGLPTLASDTLSVMYKPIPETFGIYGPGGVGDEVQLSFWLRADEETYSDNGNSAVSEDGDKVQQWNDLSGNERIAFQESTDDRPTLRLNENGINGFPVLEFNGENEYIVGQEIPSSVDLSVFSVARGTSLEWNDHGWIASARDNNGFILHPWSGTSLFNATVIDNEGGYHSSATQWIVDAGTPQIYGLIYEYDPAAQIFHKVINGDRLDFNSTNHAPRVAGALLNPRYGWDYDERFGQGQIAEHFIFNRRLFDTHRLLVVNYMAARYGMDLGPATIYDRPDMPYDVAGIGQMAFYDQHLDAQGRGIVRMKDATDMEDEEFLMWGHDGEVLEWVDTGYPLTSQHVTRTWAYEQEGDVGTVEVRIYAPELDDLGAEIGLVISATPNFEAGVLPEFIPVSNEGDYLVAMVDFEGSGVFTLGIQPTVSVEDLEQAQVAIYPNPVDQMLNLSLQGVDVNGVQIFISNSIGQRIVEIRPNNS